nr:IS3 family transposase [uncultured Corynebacterium sp.]
MLAWIPPIQGPGLKRPRSSRRCLCKSIFATFISENYGVYGVRKMWRVLRRQGIDIGREHTARLMRTEALPLQALNQAIVCAKETTGLIYH